MWQQLIAKCFLGFETFNFLRRFSVTDLGLLGLVFDIEKSFEACHIGILSSMNCLGQ
jgi:hypothetical protein